MTPPLLARISEIDSIAFIKESAPDVRRITATLQRTRGEVGIMNGNDGAAAAALAAGAHGWFAGSCSIMPHRCVEIFKAARVDGNTVRARELFEPIYPICEFMSAKGYIRVAHVACELLGRPMGTPRSPIKMLTDADSITLRTLLKNAGLLRAAAA